VLSGRKRNTHTTVNKTAKEAWAKKQWVQRNEMEKRCVSAFTSLNQESIKKAESFDLLNNSIKETANEEIRNKQFYQIELLLESVSFRRCLWK
jgi:hypothetical protein